MSRLLAYIGAPVDAATLVFEGEHSFYEQSWAPRELMRGRVNADGYGIVWYVGDTPARIAEPRPIWYEETLRTTLEAISAPVVFAALGTSTPGAGIEPSAGLLPMIRDRWAFALDGFVPHFRTAHMRALRAQLPDSLYAELRGASDAETLFLLALARIEEGGSLVDGMTYAARSVHERVGRSEAQLNMVMTDGRSLAAVRTGTALVTNSLYVAEHPPFASGGLVLTSEAPRASAVWAAVDGHSWVEIDADGSLRSELLFLD